MRMQYCRKLISSVAILCCFVIFFLIGKRVFCTDCWSEINPDNALAAADASAADLVLKKTKSIPNNPYYVYPKRRANASVGVTIIISVTFGTNLREYETALNSVKCYTALHGYSLSIEYDNKYEECAVYKDKFFRRHCHVLMLMKKEIREGDWALFIDADVGIVNPNRLIEDYIEEGYEIYLFDRFYNWEYAAQYMIKNNERGRDWVDQFAKFETKLPQSFNGTDNGALHTLMMNYLVPETRIPSTRSRMSALCYSIWNRSQNWADVFSMEACIRMVIGERVHFPEQKVKIFRKGEGWARDIWIFHSHWATDDFMLHALKEGNLTSYPSDGAGQQRCRSALFNDENATKLQVRTGPCDAVFPVLNKLNLDKCKKGTERWLMEGRLQIDNETRRKLFDKKAHHILKKQLEAVGRTAVKFMD